VSFEECRLGQIDKWMNVCYACAEDFALQFEEIFLLLLIFSFMYSLWGLGLAHIFVTF
jgi:hypothetical protein